MSSFSRPFRLVGLIVSLFAGLAWPAISHADTTPPTIQGLLTPSVVNEGQEASVSVVVTGTLPITYQWQRWTGVWVDSTDGAGYSGSQTSTLTFQTSGKPGPNSFRVVVTNAYGSVTSDYVTVIVNASTAVPPVIELQPSIFGVPITPEGHSASISFGPGASEDPKYFQWQRQAAGTSTWVDLANDSTYSGVTSTFLTISSAPYSMNGDKFRVIYSNNYGSTTSQSVTLSIEAASPPSTMWHGFNVIQAVGETAGFTVSISGGTEPFTYQWQRLPAGESIWVNLTNQGSYTDTTSSVLHVSPVSLEMNGDQFRVIVSNFKGSSTGYAGTLYVAGGTLYPTTSDPQNASVVAGDGASASFSSVGGLNGPFTYQWQRRTQGGGSWVNLSNDGTYTGATASSLVIGVPTLAMNGDQFRAVVSNANGSIISTVATLTVNRPPGPLIGTQPANLGIVATQNATFSVVATGTGSLTYQWQQNLFGIGWVNISAGSGVSGTTSATLQLTAVPLSENGKEYRVNVTDAEGTTTSDSATLTVTPSDSTISISTQPTNQTARAGSYAYFQVSATGQGGVQYLWQRKVSGGGTWVDLTTADSGEYNAPQLSLQPTAAMNGDQFRARVSDANGSTYSQPATLTVNPAVTILTHPQSVTIAAGDSATFTVNFSSSGFDSSVSWQWRPNAETAWANVGYDFPHLAGVWSPWMTQLELSGVPFSMNGYQFRAFVPNSYGSAYSEIATLTVNSAGSPPTFNESQFDHSVTVGGSQNFPVAVSGTAPFTYQWQRQPAVGGDWADIADGGAYSGATTNNLVVSPATLAMNGDKFRVKVSNSAGTVTSNASTLTVVGPEGGEPPGITMPAGTVDVGYDGVIFLSPTITGTGPFTFAWYRNGTLITDEVGNSFFRSNSTPADSGTYTLKVTNQYGTTTSSAVVVTVGSAVPLTFSAHPQSVETELGVTFNLSAYVNGTGPITYQWYRNDVEMPDSNSPVLTITNASPSAAGTYKMTATNSLGTITSNPATVVVLQLRPPQIAGWFPPRTIDGGGPLSFPVEVLGSAPLSYQWFKDDAPIAGANSATYAISSGVTAANAGTYRLQVTNAQGVAVSPDALVTWTGSTPTPWLNSGRVGDVVYFCFLSPGRILRYDLSSQSWLPLIYTNGVKTVTAFLPTAEGLFIAYDKEIVRRTGDLQFDTPVATSAVTVTGFLAAGDLLYYRDSGGLKSRNRTTLAAGPDSPLDASEADRLVSAKRPASSAAPARLFVPITETASIVSHSISSGVIAAGEVTPMSFSTGRRLLLSPDAAALVSDAGTLFAPSTLAYTGALGLPFTDAAFLSDGRLVALRNRQLMLHGEAGWAEAGRFDLSSSGLALHQRADRLFVFGASANSNGNPVVQTAVVADLATTPGSSAPGPLNRAFSIDDVFLDASKVVHVVSHSEQGIVRWDTNSRVFLSTLPLRARPEFASFAPAIGRLVLSYSDGAIADVFTSASPTEELFTNIDSSLRPLGLVGMDDLTEVRHDSRRRLVLASDGHVVGVSGFLDRFNLLESWVSATRRLYTVGSPVGWASYFDTVSATGEFTTHGDATAIFASKLRVNAEGSLLLALDGTVGNASLAKLGTLANKVDDAVWTSSGPLTIRRHPDGIQVQKWTGNDYHLAAQLSLPGFPHRILDLGGNQFVVVATVNNRLAFHFITGEPALVSTVINNSDTGVPRPALFNAEAYLAHNPDLETVVGNGADRADRAWEHYFLWGAAEGRTDGDFSAQQYLQQYPALAAVYGSNYGLAGYHWYSTGRKEGLRIPKGFDVAGYFARNADIAGLFANDKYGAWLHYYNYGVFEGRSFDANFIPGEYLELNTDLKSVFGGDLQSAVMHWFNYGHPIEDRMGRVPIGFNVDNYLARYPDLAAVFGGITPVAVRNVTVWHHYLAYGTLEGRSDGDFEANNYLNTNPDLVAVVGHDLQAAALHWYFYGRREGRRIPGGFNVQNYRSLYPDVVLVFGDDLYGSWLHYRDNGVYEGRIYDNLFRPVEYLALNPDLAAVFGSNYRDALLHWLFYGQYEGRPVRYF